MKTLVVSSLLTLALLASASANPPALTAPQAAAIAQEDLVSRGLDSKIFIAQMTYRKQSITNSNAHWEVTWSQTFDAQTEGRKETGLRITLDGNYRRSVK